MDEPTQPCGLVSSFSLGSLESLSLRQGFNRDKRDDVEGMILCVPIVGKILVFLID